MEDHIIRVTAANGYVRAFAASTTNLVEYARQIHNLSPVCSAALGRTLTASALMAVDLKTKINKLSIVINGDGPSGNIITVANSSGIVKGYVDNPYVDIPINNQGKLDVSGAVGKGNITVIKDIGLKEPYVGKCKLVSGEIAEDIAYYFNASEQQPSLVALGVFVNPDLTIRSAGGYIVQTLPGVDDEVIDRLENNAKELGPVSFQIDKGRTPEMMLQALFDSLDMKINDRINLSFECDCSRERLETLLLGLGKDELEDMIETDGHAEMICHYCNTKYFFSKDQLKVLLSRV